MEKNERIIENSCLLDNDIYISETFFLSKTSAEEEDDDEDDSMKKNGLKKNKLNLQPFIYFFHSFKPLTCFRLLSKDGWKLA